MEKYFAIKALGGTAVSAASAIGITPQAFGQWPDVLSRRLEDRVIAAIARKRLPPEAFRPESPESSRCTHEKRSEHAG